MTSDITTIETNEINETNETNHNLEVDIGRKYKRISDYTWSDAFSQIRKVTIDDAKLWLTENNFINQRLIKKSNLTLIINAMRDGTFPPYTPLYFCRLNGRLYLVDGQHRLSALCDTATEHYFTIIQIEVNNIDEVLDFYYHIDIGSPRTMPDIIKAAGFGVRFPNLTLIEQGKLAGMFAYQHYKAGGSGSGKCPKALIVDKVAEVQEQATLYFCAIKGCSKEIRKKLLYAPVLTVAIESFKQNVDVAGEFWNIVAHGSVEKTPASRLHLLVNDSKGRSGGKSGLLLEDQCRALWRKYVKSQAGAETV